MREKISFDRDWYFCRGDFKKHYSWRKDTAYVSAKTERAKLGPACKDFRIPSRGSQNSEHREEIWTNLDVPHDYHAADGYDPKENEALGFCRYENAWYIKYFTLEKEDESKRLTLLFDGVSTHATVWLNGCLMAHNFCGYTPFEVDITDYVRFGEKNVLSVFVETDEHEGWWYEGGGITRHVWLRKTAKVAVDLWGAYVRPTKGEGDAWSVQPRITLRNDEGKDCRVRVVCEVEDAEGKVVASADCGARLQARTVHTVALESSPFAARLWSPDDPYQYTMVTHVWRGKTETDTVRTRFGCRTVVADPDHGLFVNGKHYKIKGFCGHESCGLVGRAVPDNIQRYRVELMREMGANGYRTSHYPQSEALMDALDAAGFLVLDETRWFESTKEGLEQLETLIKRDRNRPGVIMWSLGNEEPFFADPRGAKIFATMRAFAQKLDDTRPFTGAVTFSPETSTIFEDCDAIGVNYKWDHIDPIHAAHPNTPVFSSECGATGTTRGWYHEASSAHGTRSAYDADVNNAFRSRERTWQFIMEREWMLGGYHWHLGEYRGEAEWPRVCSVSGAHDLYFQRKDAFYQHIAYFTDAPMVHLLPHWNHAGLEGEPIRVVAYTNQPHVELFLNGKSLGVCDVPRYGHAEWQVPYENGCIEARALDADGKTVATDRRVTAGAPAALRLSLETTEHRAGGQDMAIVFCTVVDAAGVEVPDAEPVVRFIAEGAGSIYSTGAANTDHTPITSPERKLWMGKGSAAVRTGATAGVCRVVAESAGLATATLTFTVTE